jgi:oligopeptide transport system substrate-binding protein
MGDPLSTGTAIRSVAFALAFGIALTTGMAMAADADAPVRALRVGMPLVPETLDPARADNMQVAMLMAGIYDTLYVLDPLARPAAIVPSAAAALPEISADFRTVTVRVRPGIFFTPHPSFGGRPRELTAADFAYAFKRVVDPAIRSPGLFLVEGKIEGLDALAKRAQDAGTAFDYDAPVPGLVVVDRQTLRIRLNAPDPIFPFLLANTLVAGVAREAVEAEGATYGQRPVGTGAFVVTAFAPGQRIVYTRNAAYRELHWEDLLTKASLALQPSHPMRGRRLPGANRIEFSSTPESSAELLALRRAELDLIYLSSPELATQDGRLKPEIAGAGVRLVRDPAPTSVMTFFSMRDPVVGGEATEKVALRRAIAMAFDDNEFIRVFDAGFSTMRHQVVPPGIDGYLPGYRNPNLFDPATANALLDRFAYKSGPDGYRRNPDGSALTVSALMGTSSESRKSAEFTKRMLDRIGIHVKFESVTTSERLKRMNHCRFGMSVMDWGLDVPDGTNPMSMFWSKSIGSVNMSCYADPVFDAAYEKALVTPSGQARTELFRTMQTRLDAMAPMRPRPVSDTLLLKRSDVIGPFATINDWLQVITLGVETKAAPAPAR